jgi:hypothetical protein
MCTVHLKYHCVELWPVGRFPLLSANPPCVLPLLAALAAMPAPRRGRFGKMDDAQ